MNISWEEETEQAPFPPEMEAALLKLALDRAPRRLERLAQSHGDEAEFYALPDAAAAAFHLGLLAEAQRHAERCLVFAGQFADNWNHGNAIHLGHTVLGLVAHAHGDVDAALSELRESGEAPSSPQLCSFGPTMQLAKALLREGHVDAVLDYLQRCRVFWEMGGAFLDVWEKKIRGGQVPNFFQHTHA